LTCIPALHILNVVGLMLALGAGASELVGPEELSALMLGLVTGYAMLNTIPSIFFPLRTTAPSLWYFLARNTCSSGHNRRQPYVLTTRIVLGSSL